jgi:hypothetical protein
LVPDVAITYKQLHEVSLGQLPTVRLFNNFPAFSGIPCSGEPIIESRHGSDESSPDPYMLTVREDLAATVRPEGCTLESEIDSHPARQRIAPASLRIAAA